MMFQMQDCFSRLTFAGRRKHFFDALMREEDFDCKDSSPAKPIKMSLVQFTGVSAARDAAISGRGVSFRCVRRLRETS